MSEQEREKQYQAYIDYAIEIYRDMIPYDDPDYEERLILAAISYADMEMNGYPSDVNTDNELDYKNILPF